MSYVLILVLFSLAGYTFAATPTDCNYPPYCGIGGRCITDEDPPNSTCVCYQGYRISQVTFQCEDIDECRETSAGVCPRGRCYNLDGTYKCICPPGYLSHHPDGKTCEKQQNTGGFFYNTNIFQLFIWLFGFEL